MKNSFYQISFILIVAFAVLGTAAESERDSSQAALIQIYPGKEISKVNPLIFGNNCSAANGKFIFGTTDTTSPNDGQGLWNPELKKPVPEVLEICKDVRMGMLRYPGGCLTHNFDWHQAVGAPVDRTYFKFGIDEYIEFCRTAKLEPLMTVSEICSPKDAADLVEYLNMPAKPEYPWAMKRAEWRHKEPYGVKYFEMANESDHGNHKVIPFLKRTAEEYAAWYLSCAEEMRKIDRNILIGGHAGTGTPVADPWNSKVLGIAGKQMDFFAVHTYVVGGNSEDTSLPMRACMASVDQTVAMLADYRALIRKQTGKDIPLAITEFNAGFVQEKPLPYRFTFGSALFCADYMREMLKPEQNVVFANYWQFLNGYWGYARTKNQDGKLSLTTLAAYPVFKLIGQHTSDILVDCKVSNEPKLEFPGFSRTLPAIKDHSSERIFLRDVDFSLADVKNKNYELRLTGKDAFFIEFKDFNGASYSDFKAFPVTAHLGYDISFDLKVSPENGTVNAGLGLCDERGWSKTSSGCGVEGYATDRDWTHYESSMIALNDAKGLRPVLRLKGGQNFSGKVEIRNIRISEIKPVTFPPYSALTAFATRSSDGKTVQLVVINKHHAEDIPAELRIENVKSAKIWTVSAPDLAVTKHSQDAAFERVSGEEFKASGKDSFARSFPARSISAIEFKLK